MNNDLISRKWLTDAIRNRKTYLSYEDAKDVIDLIDNAPTVEVTKPQSYVMGFCDGLKAQTYEKPPMFERPQAELSEKLKDRIEESVCKHCQMNKHCELCEISRVFQIITLTAEEQEGGADMRGGNT